MLVFVEGGKPKKLQENPAPTRKNIKLNASFGNRNRTTIVDGECSHFFQKKNIVLWYKKQILGAFGVSNFNTN